MRMSFRALNFLVFHAVALVMLSSPIGVVESRRLVKKTSKKLNKLGAETRTTTTTTSGEGLKKFACPQGCVLVNFEFGEPVSECSSCYPPDSKCRCPLSTGDNQFQRALEKSEGSFGNWKEDQCIYKEYEPSWLAFAGPSEYDGHFVKKCPKSTFCACDDVKDGVMKLWNNGGGSSIEDKNKASNVYWASLAGDEYKLYKGFSSVTGGSATHFDIIYKHKDGRKQFCGGIFSFSLSPQEIMGWNSNSVEYLQKYETECQFFPESCDNEAGFEEKGKEGCAWWGLKTIRKCESVKNSYGEYPKVVKSEGKPILNAQKSEPEWYEDSKCSKKCGGGRLVRRCHIGSGTGKNEAGAHCNSLDGSQSECNTQKCRTWTESKHSYSPGPCPNGYSWKSTDWTWWGGRKWTCEEDQ